MTIRVNGDIIPEEAIQYELQRLVRFYAQHLNSQELQGQMDVLRQKAREQAIGAKLLIDEASRLNIPVSDEEVEERLGKMVENAGGAEAFRELLKRQNLTEAGVRNSICKGRQVDKLVEKVTEGIKDPTEEDMRVHFEKHSSEYEVPEQARVQHILIKPDSGEAADRDVARSKLQEIKRRIREGADFADEAAAHSHCPSGRRSGGALGWITKGTLVAAMDQAAFSMGVGELSDVIETELGFHLIQKTMKEDRRSAAFEEVADRIREFLRHAYRGEAIATHVDELKAKAQIEED